MNNLFYQLNETTALGQARKALENQRRMMSIPQRMDLIEGKLTRIERMVEKLLKATEE